METELINNLKNIFSGVSIYQLLVDIFIPIATFVLGIFLEYKYHITNTITQKIDLKFRQSGKNNIQGISKQKSGRDSINSLSSTSIKGPLIGQQNIYPSAITPNVARAEDALKPPEPLTDTEYRGTNTDYIIDCFEKHSKKFKITSTFKDDLVKVHNDMNAYKNVDASSSGYFNIFKDAIENVINKKMFCDRDGADLAIVNVSNTFDKLEKLMSKPSKRMSELEAIIETFERNIVRLLAYI